MSTEFFNDQWRIPSNENQNKVSNYSMEFDGTNNKIDFGDVNGFDRTDAFSGSCWVNLTGSDNEFILSKQDGSTFKGYMLYVNVSRYLILYIASSSTNRILIRTNSTVANNTWQHLVFTYDGSSTSAGVKLYFNGVNQSLTNLGNTSITGSLLDSSVPFQISGRDGTSANGVNGKIDQVSIFDYALSQDQVTQLGAEGYAFNFIPNDYINLGDSNDFSFGNGTTDSPFSISAWVNMTDATSFVTIGKDATSNREYVIRTLSDDKLYFYLLDNVNGGYIGRISSGTVTSYQGTWIHTVYTYNGNSSSSGVKIYLNGSQVDNTNYQGGSYTAMSNTTTSLSIGRQELVSKYANGEISNAAILNTELTGSQVATLYNSGKPLADMSSFTSLQGWWKLDETATFNSNWSIPDASSNSNTGTSVGMDASNLVASNINGELIANPMITSPKPIAYYQLGDQSVDNGANYLVPNNSLSDYVFNFGATNESINLGNSFNYPSVVADPWTISFWVKPTNATSSGVIFSGYSFANNRGFYVNMRNFPNPTPGDRRLQCIIRSNSSTYTSVVTPSLALNEWTHVAVCYGGGGSGNFPYSFTVYFNNSPVSLIVAGGNAGTPAGSVGPNDNKYIGQLENTSYLTNAELSELSFLKYKLLANQVDTLYNNGKPGDISSLNPFTSYKLNASEIFNSTSTEWSVDNNAYPSVYKSSLNFNGSSNYIDTPQINLGSTNTISFWINNSATDIGTIFGDPNAFGSPPYALVQDTSTGDLTFRLGNNDAGYWRLAVSSGLLSDGNWHHHCLSRNGVTINYYIDGILQTNVTNNTLNASAGTNTTIEHIMANTTLASFASGKLSNVALFNSALISSQVQTLYNNGTPEASISHSPVSWWKLDNTTTGIQDSAGSNNGTNNGATEYAGFVNSLAGESSGMDSSNLVVSDLQQTSGYSPYALDFDGLNDYLDCGNDSSLQITGAMTISCWVKGTSTAGAAGVGTLEAASSPGYLLGPSATGAISFNIGLTSSSLFSASTTQQITTTEWHHIVGVYTPSVSMKIYIDGQLSKTETSNIPSSQYAGGNDFRIGYRTCCQIDGQISNVAIWNTDLSSSEITEIYNQGRPSNLHNFSGTAPVSWWQIGSNSSYNSGAWTCLDEIGTNNAVSVNMANNDIVDGPGYSESGLGTSSIDIKGDAPYSSANGLSENMDVLDRTTDVPS